MTSSLSKTGWFSSTYKLKKGTSSQLSLGAKYSILIEERNFWFDKRETKYIDITKMYDSRWVSDNLNAAKVYKGKIEAVDKGNAEISVRFYGKRKSIKIEVQN